MYLFVYSIKGPSIDLPLVNTFFAAGLGTDPFEQFLHIVADRLNRKLSAEDAAQAIWSADQVYYNLYKPNGWKFEAKLFDNSTELPLQSTAAQLDHLHQRDRDLQNAIFAINKIAKPADGLPAVKQNSTEISAVHGLASLRTVYEFELNNVRDRQQGLYAVHTSRMERGLACNEHYFGTKKPKAKTKPISKFTEGDDDL